MSSVAVLTQESFAEHRSGLVPQQIRGDSPCTLSSGLFRPFPPSPHQICGLRKHLLTL